MKGTPRLTMRASRFVRNEENILQQTTTMRSASGSFAGRLLLWEPPIQICVFSAEQVQFECWRGDGEQS